MLAGRLCFLITYSIHELNWLPIVPSQFVGVALRGHPWFTRECSDRERGVATECHPYNAYSSDGEARKITNYTRIRVGAITVLWPGCSPAAIGFRRRSQHGLARLFSSG